MSESKLLSSKDEENFVTSVIPGFNYSSKVTLIYRATSDGWKPADFHLRCNKKGSTIVLIKTTKDRVCGGFTSVSWEDESLIRSSYKLDSTAVVFSVDKQLKYPCVQPGFAVFHHRDSGPAFG